MIYFRIGQQKQEFLAAEAHHHVARPYGAAYYFREMHECGVAGRMAMVVIESLEIVDVEQRDAERCIGAVGTRGFAVVAQVEAAAVERAGQVIDVHEAAQLAQLDL